MEPIEEKIPFPFQYIESCLRGECSWDDAINNTLEEVNRLIEEYVKKYYEVKNV